MFVCVFVTYRCPNRWTKWTKIWHGGEDGPWDGLWVGVTWPPSIVGMAGKHKMTVYLLPIGTQTAGHNGLNFGIGIWMDRRTVCGGDQVLPLWWVW